MEYYRILNLVREPFSNSPEPDFFYESRHHVDCLQKLEVALRLRRGLNVVIGQVGAGKTTLSRQLIRKFSGDSSVKTFLLLDPHFSTEMEFLVSVTELFGLIAVGESELSAWQLRERVKNYLFEEAVEKNNLVVLIIDEGQKMPDFALEGLREFLNYETNEHKLLQIAVFAQEEFRDSMERNHAFADRANLIYNLGPLTFSDTRSMVHFRMKQATERGREVPVRFTGPAMRSIYKATGGYPRKIVRLCHQVLLTMIIKGRKKVDWRLVKSVIHRSEETYRPPGRLWKYPALAGVFIIILIAVLFAGKELYIPYLESILTSDRPKVASVEREISKPSAHPEEAVDQGVPSEHEEDRYNSESIAYSEQEENLELRAEPDPDEPSARAGEVTAIEDSDSASNDMMASETEPEKSDDETTGPDIIISRPVNLGTMRIAKNQFLGRTLDEIFGSRDTRIMQAFAAANPRIKNMDQVMVGQLVTIPAIPANRPQAYKGGYWIRISENTDLEETHGRYRTYLRRGLPLRMVSYWTENKGLRFAIIVNKRFDDEEAAQSALQRLPVDSAEGAEVFAGWPEGTLFFGDL
ncbi:MAG: AAA family ATPase [Syntrophales bacterium]|nr:AAA family ATPase [Syntrophales bacterium]